MKTISLCTGTNDLPNSLLSDISESAAPWDRSRGVTPHADDTYGEAVGKARAGCVATRRAVTLQDTVIQQVPWPLRRKGGAFALHDAQLTHHTGTRKKRKT